MKVPITSICMGEYVVATYAQPSRIYWVMFPRKERARIGPVALFEGVGGRKRGPNLVLLRKGCLYSSEPSGVTPQAAIRETVVAASKTAQLFAFHPQYQGFSMDWLSSIYTLPRSAQKENRGSVYVPAGRRRLSG
jgi:hypothetical protein